MLREPHTPWKHLRWNLNRFNLNDSNFFPGFRILFLADKFWDNFFSWDLILVKFFSPLCLVYGLWNKLVATILLLLFVLDKISLLFCWKCCFCSFIFCLERILNCNIFCTSDSFSVGLTSLNFGMECTRDLLVLRRPPFPLLQYSKKLQVWHRYFRVNHHACPW